MNSLPSWTDADYLTEKPYAALYELRNDAFLHRATLEAETKIASEKGFKTFKAMYKAYEDKQKGRMAVFSEGNVTEFTGQPMELETGDWIADDVAIVRRGQGFEEVACVHPIMPVQKLINVDTGVTKLELAFRRGSSWRKIISDKQTLASANKIVSLSDSDIAVTSENAKALVRYLHDVENMNYDAIPQKPSIGRLGHIPGHGFSPYVEGLEFDGSGEFRSAFAAVTERGSLEKWIAEIKDMRAYSVAAKIVIAASFASALIEPFGLLPFFVHLWATTSGSGKTVALMAAASVWADPSMGRYVKTFDSTNVGYEFYAGFLNSLPMVIDELQLARDERGRSKFNVYKLAEGVGRLRGNRGRGIDQTVTWRNCIITSGESPLALDNAGAGALNRIIDIECDNDSKKIVRDGRTSAAVISANYGHAGKEFVRRLTPEVIARENEAYTATFRALSASDATDKQALSAAVIITADRLVSDWFFHDAPIGPEDMIGFLQTNASVDINERAYAFLCDWIMQNANRFQKDAQEVYGVIENDRAYIIRNVFNRVIEGEGYSARGFLGWMKRRGLIETRGKAYTVGKSIGGIKAEFVSVRLQEDGDAPF